MDYTLPFFGRYAEFLPGKHIHVTSEQNDKSSGVPDVEEDAAIPGPAGEEVDPSVLTDEVDERASGGDDEAVAGEESDIDSELEERLSRPVFEGTAGIEAAQVWFAAFLIAVAGLLAYSNAFSSPFTYEDNLTLVNNPNAHSVTTLPAAMRVQNLPPLPALTYALNWALAPGIPGPLRAINIFVHAMNGILVYLLARRLLGLGRVIETGEGGFELREPLAMLAGLLFVLHPVATEAVNLIVGRSYLLCTTFMLLAVLAYLRSVRDDGLAHPLGVAVAGLMSALAWACDWMALCIPALILAADWIIHGGGVFRRIGAHAVLWSLAILMGTASIAGRVEPPLIEQVLSPKVPPSADAKAVAFSRGMALLLNPSVLNVEYDIPPKSGFLDPFLAQGQPIYALSTGIGFALIALILIGVRSPAGIALAWSLAGLLPGALFWPPLERFTERPLYISVAGLVLALPWLVSKLPRQRGILMVAGASTTVLLVAAGSGAYMRNRVWQDPLTLWRDAADKSPDSVQPIRQLGFLHHITGQTELTLAEQFASQGQAPAAATHREAALRALREAENYLRAAAELDPDDGQVHSVLGVTLSFLGRRDDAIQELVQSLRINPSNQDTMLRIASLYHDVRGAASSKDNLARAIDYYRAAERLGGLPPEARVYYSSALASIGDIRGAGVQLAVVVPQGDTTSPAAQRLGQLAAALRAAQDLDGRVREAAEKDPAGPEASRLQIQQLLAEGRTLQSFYMLDRFLRDFPEDAEGWLMMGMLRARVGDAERFIEEHPAAPPAKEGEPPLWMQLVRQCANSGAWGPARAYAVFAAEQTPGLELPLLRLAEMALEMKQPEVAAPLLGEAVKAYPENPLPLLLLCDIAIESNNLSQARKYLDEAERLGARAEDVAPRREKAGETPDEEKRRVRTILQ